VNKPLHSPEPFHLTPAGGKPINWVEQKENERRQREERDGTGIRAELDGQLDACYAEHGITETLTTAIYRVMFFVRFKEWPSPGKALWKIAPDYKLERLHEAWMRICYPPEDLGGDERTMTIWDYDGKSERFSAFVNRLIGNGYKSLKKKAIRAQDKEIHFEENGQDRSESGGISEGHAMEEAALPEVGAVDCNSIPGELGLRLENLNHHFQQYYPEVAHAHLNLGETSASEIARMVKSGETAFIKLAYEVQFPNPNRPKTTKDRERIKEITKAFKGHFLRIVTEYVRERQAVEVENAKANKRWLFTPKNLDDPKVLLDEVRRVMGWRPRTKNPVGFKDAQRSFEQKLGFNTYHIGKGANLGDIWDGDRTAFLGASRRGDAKVKGSLYARQPDNEDVGADE
jgi:hypothetical protein